MTELSGKVLALLEAQHGACLSGARLAETLAVSRTAIWKAVEQLRRDGFQIEAKNRAGYRLVTAADVLAPQYIKAALAPQWRGIPITVYPTIDSTNRAAKIAAEDGAPHGSVIMAEQQTAGRGRRGRSFYSPPKSGLYLSVILRPGQMKAEPAGLTMTAAVAVCRALRQTLGVEAQIKWVNDVFWQGLKVCGILSEAAFDLESRCTASVVVGIGLNVTTSEFPQELRGIAGAVSQGDASRAQIAAAILNELLSLTASGEDTRAEYAERMFLLGKQICYIEQGIAHRARALQIDPDGALVVLDKNNREKHLRSAEISIRAAEED